MATVVLSCSSTSCYCDVISYFNEIVSQDIQMHVFIIIIIIVILLLKDMVTNWGVGIKLN